MLMRSEFYISALSVKKQSALLEASSRISGTYTKEENGTLTKLSHAQNAFELKTLIRRALREERHGKNISTSVITEELRSINLTNPSSHPIQLRIILA
jgi:hypothetical protein